MGLILIVSVLALSFPMFDHAPPAYSAQQNRITSIHPTCADPGDRVTIWGYGFGGHNIIVTVGGIRARVIHATGHSATFLVPASAPYGPATAAIRHRKGSQLGSIAFQVGCGQANRPPVANAGPDQEVTVGQLVTLDGRSSSDPDGDLITYQWTITSAPTANAGADQNVV